MTAFYIQGAHLQSDDKRKFPSSSTLATISTKLLIVRAHTEHALNGEISKRRLIKTQFPGPRLHYDKWLLFTDALWTSIGRWINNALGTQAKQKTNSSYPKCVHPEQSN